MNAREEIARLQKAIEKSKSPYLKRDYAKRIERIRNDQRKKTDHKNRRF